MPLSMLNTGDAGVIRQLHGQPKVVKHLEDMGFVAGESVTVISSVNGNLIVEIKGTRLALNLVTANRIILEN